jgi:hypothetical protein
MTAGVSKANTILYNSRDRPKDGQLKKFKHMYAFLKKKSTKKQNNFTVSESIPAEHHL